MNVVRMQDMPEKVVTVQRTVNLRSPGYTAAMKNISASLFIALATSALLAACARAPSDDPELILTGGLIYPLTDNEEPVPALAIRGDAILAIGSDAEILGLAGEYTQQMRLEGAVVLPGAYDAWIDLEALGRWNATDLDLRLASSVEEVQAMVRNAAGGTTRPATDWVIGWGWDENDWPAPLLPDRTALDATGVERPIALIHRNGRSAWLNSAGLAALPALPGEALADPGSDGVIRDSNGKPSGVLVGGALNALSGILGGGAETHAAWLASGARLAGAAGITRAATSPVDVTVIESLLKLESGSALPLRVDVRLAPTAVAAYRATNLPRRLEASALVRVVAVGARLDGPLSSRLAVINEPYQGGTPSPAPALESALQDALDASRDAGLPLHLHASGDLAISLALTALDEGRAPGGALIGFDLLPPEGLQDLSGLWVALAAGRFARDIYWLDRVLGPQRAQRAHAWSDLADAGVSFSFASDAPAYPARPLAALAAALTRQDAEGYPAGGWNLAQSLPQGRLVRALMGDSQGFAPGAPADLVVWSEDPVTGSPDALRRAAALLTIVAGRVAYSRALVELPMGSEQSP